MKKEIVDFYEDSHEQEILNGVEINAYRTVCIFKDEKGKEKTERVNYCSMKTETKFLNLGQCWDGNPFQSVKHAINEAKWFINNRAEMFGWV